MIRGSKPRRGKRFFSSPNHPHRLCDPPSLLFNGYLVVFPRVRRPERDVGHSPLVPRLRISGDKPILPLHAFMAWTGKNLPFLPFQDYVYMYVCMYVCVYIYIGNVRSSNVQDDRLFVTEIVRDFIQFL
jgi:hypothetical protein